VRTLQQLLTGIEAIPATTSWYLADLGEARGKQELFARQSPQTLKALREHALLDSAVSLNGIEGVVADQARVGTIEIGIEPCAVILEKYKLFVFIHSSIY
jgi:hypothetical protein